MDKKYQKETIILAIFLGLRLWGQFEQMFSSPGAMIMFFVYLAVLIGIYLRKKWAAVLSGILALIDIIITVLLLGGAIKFGALVIDLGIVCFAYSSFRIFSMVKKVEKSIVPT